MAPLWWSKYRSTLLGMYMTITFLIYFSWCAKLEKLHRNDDPNRIENIRSALQLEDLDFIKMVDDLNLQLNEVDLKDIEKKIDSRVSKVIPRESRALV